MLLLFPKFDLVLFNPEKFLFLANNDDKLKISFIKNHSKNKKLSGIFTFIALTMGLIISIGVFNYDFQKMGVKEYLRGNVEVKQKTIYEDSMLIKCDTIINLK